MKDQSVGEVFRQTCERFKTARIESARLDARVLVGLILGGGAERVLADNAKILTRDEIAHLETLVQRRLAREPISHIVGAREFWSLNFQLNGATLAPRPDTETVVEAVLDHARASSMRILDLGTGSGCILLALLNERPDASGVGIDASAEALEVAQNNAKALGFAPRARFVQADWDQDGWTQICAPPFDVIVSNPPYIPEQDIEFLQADVRDYEPRAALSGGTDGLEAYRAIIPRINDLLNPHGVCVFEVGIYQAAPVAALLETAKLKVVECRKDLGGIERAVIARKEIRKRG